MIQIQKLNTQINRGSGREDKDTVDMVTDLKTHVQQLNHNNSALRTKLQFFKTLYETESRKKGQYTHIPPRVETGISRKLKSKNPSLPLLSQAQDDGQQQQDTISELQELNTKYRLKISLLDETVQKLERDNVEFKDINTQLQKNWDVDKVSLQHEIHDLKKKIVDQRAKFDTVDEHYKSLDKAYKEMLTTTQALGNDLNAEREKNCELESTLQKERLERQKNEDVLPFNVASHHH
jgi:chromosome segregation ATPase